MLLNSSVQCCLRLLLLVSEELDDRTLLDETRGV